ncbi:MAG: PEGA domain-containing protein [Balneola sp.]
MIQKSILSALAFLLITNCATITKGTNAEIRVSSEPEGAEIYINNILKGETPTTLTLSRKTDHVLEFRKEGYESMFIEVNRKFDVGTSVFGNAIFGGLIGLIIDTSNGSAYSLKPADIEANLIKLESTGYIQKNDLSKDHIQVFMMTIAQWEELTK